MIIFPIFSVLTSALTILFFCFFGSKRDIFHPVRLTAYIYALSLPYNFVLLFDPARSIFFDLLGHDEFMLVFAWVTLIETLIFLTFVISIYASTAFHRIKVQAKVKYIPFGTSPTFGIAAFVTAFGIILSLYFYDNIGGLMQLWANMAARTEFTAGNGWLMALYTNTIYVGITALVYSFSSGQKKKRTARSIILFVLFSGCIIALGGAGGRTPVIFLFSTSTLAFHYYYRNISYRDLKAIIIVAFSLFLYGAAIAYIRTISIDTVQGTESRDVYELLLESLSHLNKTDIDILIYKTFSIDNIWLGKSYLNLLNILPLFSVENRPAIDDGVYVLSLLEIGRVDPNASLGELTNSSWPPGLWFGFMQFHYLGLFAFASATGFLKGSIYSIFIKNRSFYIFVILIISIYPFLPTVHGIVNLLSSLVIVLPLILIMHFLLTLRVRRRSYQPVIRAIRQFSTIEKSS